MHRMNLLHCLFIIYTNFHFYLIVLLLLLLLLLHERMKQICKKLPTQSSVATNAWCVVLVGGAMRLPSLRNSHKHTHIYTLSNSGRTCAT